MLHEIQLHCPSLVRCLSIPVFLFLVLPYIPYVSNWSSPVRVWLWKLALIEITTICDHLCDLWVFMVPFGQAPGTMTPLLPMTTFIILMYILHWL